MDENLPKNNENQEENLPETVNDEKSLMSQGEDLFFLDNFTTLADALVDIASVDKKQTQDTYEFIKQVITRADNEYLAELQRYELKLHEYETAKALVRDGKMSSREFRENYEKPFKPKRPNISSYLRELNAAMKNSVDSTDKLVRLTETFAKIFVKQVEKNNRKIVAPKETNNTQINIESLRVDLLNSLQNNKNKENKDEAK